MSQITFSAEGSVSPKKPSSLPEVAKQRELSGTLESEAASKTAKQISESKSKELSGSDIFGPPPEVPARPLAARNLELRGNLDFALPQPRSIHTSVKVSNVRGSFHLNDFSLRGHCEYSLYFMHLLLVTKVQAQIYLGNGIAFLASRSI